MPDGLYEHDILAWSQHQADLLRRLGRGERVNDVDWTSLAEEIEALGRSELRSLERFLTLMLLRLLKLRAWPDNDACNHCGEARSSGSNSRRIGTLVPRCGRRSMSARYRHIVSSD